MAADESAVRAPESGTPRTLTQMMRGWDDAAVVQLIVERPDLIAEPAPTDFSQLAAISTTRDSVGDALDELTAYELWLANRSCSIDAPFSFDQLVAVAENKAAATAAAARLHEMALLWGDASALRPVRVMPGLVEGLTSFEPPAEPPQLASGATRTAELVDRAAAGTAFELVRRIEMIVEHCLNEPIKLVRDGGLASRDVRALASMLDVKPTEATEHLALARASGLLHIPGGDLGHHLTASPAFASWQALDLAEQWGVLIAAWFSATETATPQLAALALRAFGEPAEGRVVTLEALMEWLGWHRPRRFATARVATKFIEQAARLGLTAMDARSSYVSADGRHLELERLGAHLPPRVEQVIVQADLTAVAPGPLTPEAARELSVLGDVESHGGATVYRFSSRSLMRARQHGWSPATILDTLKRRSSTPLPQPLTYLIDDLSRRQFEPLARIPDLPGLANATATARLLGNLRAAEQDLDGLKLRSQIAAALVEEMRANDEGPRRQNDGSADDRQSRTPVLESPIDALREASESGEVVWFDFVDKKGQRAERLVDGVAVEDGLLTGTDVRTREDVRVKVHRVISVHIVRSG